MSEALAFKAGFLAHAADCGYTFQQTEALVDRALARVKAAGIADTAKAIGGVGAGAYAAAQPVAQNVWWGLTRSLIPIAGLGAAGGYGLAKMTDIDDTDVDEAKKWELIEEYRRQAQKLKGRQRVYLR